jgi:hypothetical protein
MGTITLSLWLPVGRANFFSTTTDPELITHDSTSGAAKCSSPKVDEREEIPYLRASVMRRVLEVLPRSFGYQPVGECAVSILDDVERPIAIAMRLVPDSPWTELIVSAVEANADLVATKVDLVEFTLEENGLYTFTASYSADGRDDVRKALISHITAVFGGKFTVDRLRHDWPKGFNEGAAAINRYNGIRQDAWVAKPEDRTSEPLGILTFFQLNILVEGLCNQALLPSVFFERYEFAKSWLTKFKGKTSVLITLEDLVPALITERGATEAERRISALHRFFAVSRGSLQRLKRSVGSVRRQLLNEIMRVLHRQARLIQLDLGAVDYEATPELTGPAATESQMRGYVMLIAVKLPLIRGIDEAATAAVAELVAAVPAPAGTTGRMSTEADNLAADLRAWQNLLRSLYADVRALEGVVKHDWQERMLYEQEQSRAEQEAMAEIERGRRGRQEGRRTSDAAYNAMVLVLSVAALLFLVRTTPIGNFGTITAGELLIRLWPLVPITFAISMIAPFISWISRRSNNRNAKNDSYSFEFTFRIDEATSPEKVANHLSRPQVLKVDVPELGTLTIRRLGGWRIEQTALDRTLMKAHSLVALKVGNRYARFEVVTEVVSRAIAEGRTHSVRQCRMFGDSPEPLPFEQINTFVETVLLQVCQPLANDGRLDLDKIMASTNSLCRGANGVVAASAARGPGISSAPGASPKGKGTPRQRTGQTDKTSDAPALN